MLDSAFKELSRMAKSDVSSEHASTSSGPSRISLLPSVRLPSFSRQSLPGSSENPSPHDKQPLLTLRLSSRSFIDTTITDDIAKSPLYTTKTVGATTRVSRNSTTQGQMQFATIRWPKVLPTKTKGKGASDGVEIQMGNSRYIGGETLLTPGPKPNSAHRFRIPAYSHQLKWKRRGDVYWCTTADLKGPIATLEPAKDKNPTKLTIYETLRDRYDARSVLYYEGVYLLLLDYLIVTAMLLLTDLQDWMLVKVYEGKSVALPNPVDGGNSSVEASASQWRKIMYREPIYPKLNGGSTASVHSSRDSLSYPPTPSSEYDHSPSNPHAPSHWGSSPTRPTFHSSIFQSVDQSISMLSLSDSEDEDDYGLMEAAIAHTGPGSPVDSIPTAHYSGSFSQPPSHNYVDPSFYPPTPPVPPLPLQYARSTQSLRGEANLHSSSISPPSRTPLRERYSEDNRYLPSRGASLPPTRQTAPTSSPSSKDSSNSNSNLTMARPSMVSDRASTASAPAAVVGRTRSMTTGESQRSRSPWRRPLPSVPGSARSPVHQHAASSLSSSSSNAIPTATATAAAAPPSTQLGKSLPSRSTSSATGAQQGNDHMNTVRRARSHATLVEDEYRRQQQQVLLSPPAGFSGAHRQYRYSDARGARTPQLSLSATTAASTPGRSLPQTPISSDPRTPHPELLQEELRVTAATVQMLRSQHHQECQQHGPQNPPTIRIPTSPLRKGTRGHGRRRNAQEDEDVGGEAQWVRVLGSPPAGNMVAEMAADYYDMPPPAYAESEAAYRGVHWKPDQ